MFGAADGSTATKPQVAEGASAYVPLEHSLASLRSAVQACKGCELYEHATQAVFGEGAVGRVMFIGEAPGDQEDLQGQPFVGPAGAVFGRALEKIGLDRNGAYVTNAVKHFKWTPRGKRRIHETPRASEIHACRPWIEAEIDAVAPSLIVLMGSTAVQSILGPSTKVLANRGRIIESGNGPCLITVHPSSILRVPDPEQQEPAFNAFVADLRKGQAYLEKATQ